MKLYTDRHYHEVRAPQTTEEAIDSLTNCNVFNVVEPRHTTNLWPYLLFLLGFGAGLMVAPEVRAVWERWSA